MLKRNKLQGLVLFFEEVDAKFKGVNREREKKKDCRSHTQCALETRTTSLR